jgi:hypothetical protein
MAQKPRKGTFQKGHKVAEKLKTDDLKLLAYQDYCKHLAKGYSQKSWCFVHKDLTLTWDSMERYIKEYAAILLPIHKQVAKSKGQKTWENVIFDSAKGHNEKANTASLQMIMRNMYDWDKREEEKTASPKEEAIEYKEEVYKLRQENQLLKKELHASQSQTGEELQRSDSQI